MGSIRGRRPVDWEYVMLWAFTVVAIGFMAWLFSMAGRIPIAE